MNSIKFVKYLLLLIIVSLQLSLKGQSELFASELEMQIHQALYNFHFTEARLLRENITIQQPTTAIIFKTQELWWEAISTDGSFSAVNDAINRYHEQYIPVTQDIGCLYFAALELRISVASKRYYAAFQNWRQITTELKKHPLDTTDTVSLFIHGIANCIKGELQRKFPFLVKDKLSFQENITKGVDMLESCCQSTNSIISSESHYYLMRYYSDILHSNALSLPHSQHLIDLFPDNYVFRYYHILNLMETDTFDKTNEAITTGIQNNDNSNYYSQIQRNYSSQLMNLLIELNNKKSK